MRLFSFSLLPLITAGLLCFGNPQPAEAASGGLMKLREEQAMSELAVVTRKVRLWLTVLCS